MAKMYLEEALAKIVKLEGRKLGTLGDIDLVNKGRVGQLIELSIGMDLSSNLNDFVDGELKTNKFLKGKPAETLAVTQLPHVLEQIADKVSWEDSKVCKKLASTIIVPIHKDKKEPKDWVIGKAIHLNSKKHKPLFNSLSQDFIDISVSIREVISSHTELHTTNGRNGLLQIRTKDSRDIHGNYHPVVFNNRALSNKNFAFYARPNLVSALLKEGS